MCHKTCDIQGKIKETPISRGFSKSAESGSRTRKEEAISGFVDTFIFYRVIFRVIF